MASLKNSIAETERFFDAIAPWAFHEKDAIPEEIRPQIGLYLCQIENRQLGFMPFYRRLAPEFFEWAEELSQN